MARKFDRSLLPPAPNLSFEKELWASGIARVAGIDEAGRGALAGPVAAAIVILPPTTPALTETLAGVRDSKEMTAPQREHWAAQIHSASLASAVGLATPSEVDAHGIVPATRLAIRRALQELAPPPEHLLIDYLRLPRVPIPQTSLVKGDARSLSIAAASILAKTTRDAHMLALADQYPGYGFASNKGYGTAAHLAALVEHGPTPHHRRSFAPLKPRLI